jgi:hypothetical protein
MTEGKFFTTGKMIYALSWGDKLEMLLRQTAVLFNTARYRRGSTV